MGERVKKGKRKKRAVSITVLKGRGGEFNTRSGQRKPGGEKRRKISQFQ